MKVKSESEVAQSCLTLHDPVDRSLPGSSIHGIVQARVQAWVTIAFYEILILINCKKDSDHPFHKRCKEKFQSSREPANFCKVQFCEVFGWMGSSRVQVCVTFCRCDLTDGRTWGGRRGMMSSIWSSVKTRLQIFYGLRLPMKWGHSRVFLKSSSLVYSMRIVPEGTLDRDFCLGKGHFPSIRKWREGLLLRLF